MTPCTSRWGTTLFSFTLHHPSDHCFPVTGKDLVTEDALDPGMENDRAEDGLNADESGLEERERRGGIGLEERIGLEDGIGLEERGLK